MSDERLIQRLIDGELSPVEIDKFLERCHDRTELWRVLALALLEQRSWETAALDWVGSAPSLLEVPPSDASRFNATPSKSTPPNSTPSQVSQLVESVSASTLFGLAQRDAHDFETQASQRSPDSKMIDSRATDSPLTDLQPSPSPELNLPGLPVNQLEGHLSGALASNEPVERDENRDSVYRGMLRGAGDEERRSAEFRSAEVLATKTWGRGWVEVWGALTLAVCLLCGALGYQIGQWLPSSMGEGTESRLADAREFQGEPRSLSQQSARDSDRQQQGRFAEELRSRGNSTRPDDSSAVASSQGPAEPQGSGQAGRGDDGMLEPSSLESGSDHAIPAYYISAPELSSGIPAQQRREWLRRGLLVEEVPTVEAFEYQGKRYVVPRSKYDVTYVGGLAYQ